MVFTWGENFNTGILVLFGLFLCTPVFSQQSIVGRWEGVPPNDTARVFRDNGIYEVYVGSTRHSIGLYTIDLRPNIVLLTQTHIDGAHPLFKLAAELAGIDDLPDDIIDNTMFANIVNAYARNMKDASEYQIVQMIIAQATTAPVMFHYTIGRNMLNLYHINPDGTRSESAMQYQR
jgi:hypothetical protein